MSSYLAQFCIALCHCNHQLVVSRARRPRGEGEGGGGFASGAVAASTCSGICTNVGGGNYMVRNLMLNTATGIFSGSLTTNSCPNHAGAYQYGGVLDMSVKAGLANCQTWTLPVTGYTSFPIATPLRGQIGYTISGGESVFGPMDAGFDVGSVCTTSMGTCPAGTDTLFCGALIEKACGTRNLKGNTTASMHMLLSDCGGHAGYHNHERLGCEYAATAAGHSTLVAVLLDGRGVYGQYETTATKPTNLDACNGHYGATPATTVGGDTYPATTFTYHYHMTAEAPFLAGCFGPVTTLAAARELYPSCLSGGATCSCSQSSTCSCPPGTKMLKTCTSLGSVATYTLDCPVYSVGALPIINTTDPDCVPCAGNCPVPGTTGEPTKPEAGSSTTSIIIGAVVGGAALLIGGVVCFSFFCKATKAVASVNSFASSTPAIRSKV